MKEGSGSRTIHPFVLNLQGGAPQAIRSDPPQIDQWKQRGFVIQNFLSVAECNTLITTARGIGQQAGKAGEGFEKLDTEYPAAYRSNSRLLMRSPVYAGALYRRLLGHFKPKDIYGIRPYGFENSGVWKPAKLNDVIKVSHYKANNEFKPHFDGSVAEDDQTRSIFTLLIYLNEAYKGGETEFYHNEEKFKIKPKTGLAILFNHDLRHAGLPVTWGGKYILKTEVMFRSFSAPDPAVLNDPLFKEVDALYDKSAELEKNGDAAAATEVYIKALSIQTRNGSVPTEVVVSKQDDATAEIPLTVVVHFLKYLSAKELIAMQNVSKRWTKLAQNEFCWHPVFLAKFPALSEGVIVSSHKQDAFLVDWFQLFKTSTQATRSKVVTMDIGALEVKYKIANSTPLNTPNVSGPAQSTHWGAPHGHSPFRTIEEIYVFCDDIETYYGKRFPVSDGKIKDWVLQAKIIKWIFKKKLKLHLETTPLIFAEENTATDEDHRLIIQNAFEVLNLPSICVVPSAVLAIIAAGKESGLAIEYSMEKGATNYTTLRVTLSPVANSVLQRQGVSVWNKTDDSVASAIHKKLAEFKDDKAGVTKNVILYGTVNAQQLEELTKELKFLFMDQPMPTIALATENPLFACVEGGDLAATLSQTTSRFKFMTRADYYNSLSSSRYEEMSDMKKELEMVRKLRAAMLGN